MSKKIVVINGNGGVGKDAFIFYCGYKYQVANYSSVDLIKQMGKLCGYAGEKTEKDRLFLSRLKSAAIAYNDAPFKYLKERVLDFLDKGTEDIIFLHIREPEEIQKIVNEFPDAVTLLIKNNRVKDIESNPSDASVYDYNYDYVVYNNGDLKELETNAYIFLDSLMGKKY